ncbi:GspH/FimT family pseudopilin [Paracidovorax citrulli]|uniref:Type II secretion system protein H n=2 Tax=Paracidovorax citrulli TaxID=80869 RepID=A1TT12_PARC0|nr:GspH/FimT family pseudopilin [Paracidovorax citrulli]ABM34100.1 Tfp pilus assembly protein FimT [Paracidovorax citrulli AAC00-1]ATG96863.1 pilus assembly protein FimT [Paracidovorax citrulli]PVY63538.1 type IV fimbrial biogenesis protein FimT [Paracidovorax citrulli]QCX09534.1 Type IV pilus assembly protein FimT [Paracidovorax citrulli]REG67496.1 type IV fimbrial biogenesis protein FimT [Paracidovorax citrulli]
MRNNLHCGSQASQGPRIARRHRGFTLIELMVTMALVAVLLRIGIPSFVSFQRNSELTSAANGLLASVNSARTEAMKRNMNAGLVPTTGSSWGGGWTAFVDIDGNGSFDAAKDLVVSTQPALASYFSVTGTGTATGDTPSITFNSSGYVKDFGNVTLEIARNDLSDAALLEQTRRVVIFKTGRVRVCKPTSATDAACSSGGS